MVSRWVGAGPLNNLGPRVCQYVPITHTPHDTHQLLQQRGAVRVGVVAEALGLLAELLRGQGLPGLGRLLLARDVNKGLLDRLGARALLATATHGARGDLNTSRAACYDGIVGMREWDELVWRSEPLGWISAIAGWALGARRCAGGPAAVEAEG